MIIFLHIQQRWTLKCSLFLGRTMMSHGSDEALLIIIWTCEERRAAGLITNPLLNCLVCCSLGAEPHRWILLMNIPICPNNLKEHLILLVYTSPFLPMYLLSENLGWFKIISWNSSTNKFQHRSLTHRRVCSLPFRRSGSLRNPYFVSVKITFF